MILPDVLAHDLKVVFCGTAVGTASAKRGAYYAGPGNLFWPTLHRIGLTPYQLKPAEYQTVTAFGIGLTDIVKTRFGEDACLVRSDFDAEGLRDRLLQFSPNVLAFNGKRAAKEFFGRKSVDYGLQAKEIGQTQIVVLPSTSGAARGFWDENEWVKLGQFLAQLES